MTAPAATERAAEGWRGASRQLVRRLGFRRLLVTFLLLVSALLFARYAMHLPLTRDVERGLYDARLITTAPRVDEDPRITLIVYEESTLAATGKRSPVDRAILARALANLDGMGLKAIGIDILIDQATPEDAQLIAVLKRMRTPVWLAFSSNADTTQIVQPWQEQFMRDFLVRVGNPRVRQAAVRLDTDLDNAMRKWSIRPPGVPPVFANAMAPPGRALNDYDGGVLYRLPRLRDRNVFGAFAIELFGEPEMAQMLADQIRLRGRYVLIGSRLADIDVFDTPLTRLGCLKTAEQCESEQDIGQMPGVEVHASMLAQALDGRRQTPIGGSALWVAAVVVVLMGAGIGALDLGPWRLGFALLQSAALLVGVPVLLQATGYDTLNLPMFGWLGGWLLALVAVGGAARAVHSDERRFAQGALGKYLPADVAKAIIANPDQLSLKGEKRQIYALFTDMEGFTKLTHQISAEQIAKLLNRYLDLLSQVVFEHGGTLDKFVGDAVVAFWGAPISRDDDADRVSRAALAMYAAGERFRAEAPPGSPPIGRTRVGVHMGEAIVGNLGGEGRMQYTALGDCMNAAARLEGANKSLKTTLLVSSEVVAESTLACFRPMGRVTVRGRATPIDVYEAVPGIAQDDIDRIAGALEAYDRGDEAGLERLRAFAAERPDDAALACLVSRLETVGPGGSYDLD